MSPTLSRRISLVGIVLDEKLRKSIKHSLFQRFQKSFAVFYCSLNSFGRFVLLCNSGPFGIVMSCSPTRKCAGVSTSSSFCELGPELNEASVLTRIVHSPSSSMLEHLSTFQRQCLVEPNIVPPSSLPSRTWSDELSSDSLPRLELMYHGFDEVCPKFSQFPVCRMEGLSIVTVNSVGDVASANEPLECKKKFVCHITGQFQMQSLRGCTREECMQDFFMSWPLLTCRG